MIKTIKKYIKIMNEKGIPLPMIRSNKTGKGSVSLTMVVVSFNIWLISIIGKSAGLLGGMDSAQTLNMFMVSCGLYFGRKLQNETIEKD